MTQNYCLLLVVFTSLSKTGSEILRGSGIVFSFGWYPKKCTFSLFFVDSTTVLSSGPLPIINKWMSLGSSFMISKIVSIPFSFDNQL